MQGMLVLFPIFLLFTVAMFHFVWKAIQPGAMLGKWQTALDWMYEHKMKGIAQMLGGCKMCFAHYMAIFGFVCFYVFTSNMELWIVKGWSSNIITYWVFVSISWFASLKTSKDGL